MLWDFSRWFLKFAGKWRTEKIPRNSSESLDNSRKFW
jgi:hypothetical protein